MNYKTYKTLTNEQKEEYMYSFHDTIKFDSVKFILALSSLYGLISSLLLLISMIYINDNLKHMIPQAQIIMKTLMQINKIVLPFLLIYVLVQLIDGIIKYYLYRRFLKRNNIKYVYFWVKN